MEYLDQLAYSLSRLPGIGKKSATRLSYHMLQCDRDFLRSLGNLITSLPDEIMPCEICGNYSDRSRCAICSDGTREAGMLCIVEHPQDIAVIESAQAYRGYYHVLHGALSPLNGINPSDLNLSTITHRVSESQVQELILATNPTVEGDATALYIKNLFEGSSLRITRLALGLPVGGDLEFADRLTLARSLRGRVEL